MDITELRSKLKTAREAYYNLSPVISDLEYDALKDTLRQLAPDDVEVTAVGAVAPKYSVWDKVEHEIPMGSLNKVNQESGFRKWIIDQNLESQSLLITYKLDGSSLEVIYEDGNLKRCSTRGNGVIGEDITANAIKIDNLPKQISKSGKIIVRGEVLMHKDIFQNLYSKDYANPRNTAAGKIRDKKGDGKDCKNLKFYAFTMIGINLSTYSDQLAELRNLGFDTPDYFIGDLNQIISSHQVIIDQRTALPYEIDGTVISVNDLQYLESLGSHNLRPNGQIAWKFDPAAGITKIIDIKWQVGNSGRLCPVGVVDPVEIGGVTITNVSLHNLAMFKKLELHQGDEVLITRRNDVIPYLEKNVTRNLSADDEEN